MAEPVVIGNATLYLGDCREILPALPQVDVVVTDPPYSQRTHSKARKNVSTNGSSPYRQTARRLVDFPALSDEEFVEIARACLKSARRWVVMTCDHRHAALTFDWPEHIRLGAWVKVAPMPSVSGDRPGSGHESVLIMHNQGPKRWNRGGGSAVWRLPPMKSTTEVATQKPLNLVSAFIGDFSEPGETVLDPFMGSGTTGVACNHLGRPFIGIEREPSHFEIACRRIEDAQRQGRLIA